ncbi:putative pentatricopeptide repeat-containing protein At5g43820 [Ziziphus jujuba]|uniref:Pentatricopeptide repeat-containing protein At5g43820 n=1 Tax=Ziziphus jujuba TaxID=326968 RepID=A0A6P4ALB3_ZIZJJ|nr:putative pentatricopeptide repeat-containing protein At5g43820 [Ziziphus jujuba]
MAFGGIPWCFLASQSQRYLGLSRHLRRARHPFPCLRLPIPLFSFSTLSDSSYTFNDEYLIKHQSTLDERNVLDELSNLLPVSCSTSATNLYKKEYAENKIDIRAADGFLSPEDKLRGVFLQKLKGKTAIEHALSNVGVELNLNVVAEVVNRGSLGSEDIVIFSNWAIKQPLISKDIHFYHIILRALGRRKFFKDMIKILRDMRTKGINPNLETISIVMDSFLRARQVSKAIQTFRNLEEVGLNCETKTLNVLLQCLCQRSHVGTANSFLNSMKGKIPFNGTTYNIVVNGWSKFGRISEMERLLDEMVVDGISPDSLTFTHLIDGFGRAGQIDKAIEIFENMKQGGCLLNTSSYNAMISNFIYVGDFDEATKYYRSMLSNNCEADIDTYTSIITGFLKARKVADALEMFDEMLARGVFPPTGTLTSFIKTLCSYGPPHAAMIVYRKAKAVGCRFSSSAYKLLLMRLSRFGKCGMLLSIWNEMQECGYSSDVEVYEYVINGLCNVGQLENAVLVMEECLRKGFCPSRLICSKVNHKLLDSNKVEKAYKLFLKIKVARRNDNARRFWRSKGWHF